MKSRRSKSRRDKDDDGFDWRTPKPLKPYVGSNWECAPGSTCEICGEFVDYQGICRRCGDLGE